MHGLPIFKKDDAQGTVVHFGDERPTSYTPTGLPLFSQRMLDGTHNPIILDDGPIWATARIKEAMGCFHKRICSLGEMRVLIMLASITKPRNKLVRLNRGGLERQTKPVMESHSGPTTAFDFPTILPFLSKGTGSF